jgi:hypothetical protein
MEGKVKGNLVLRKGFLFLCEMFARWEWRNKKWKKKV